MTLSTIGALALGLLGAWIFGGVVLRLTGCLLVLSGLLGLASTGDANGIVVFTLGACLWLAGHLHFRMHHAVFKSALAEWLWHTATSTWRRGLEVVCRARPR